MTTQTFRLSLLDNQAYPCYMRFVLCFPLREDTSQSQVVESLQHALNRLRTAVPWVAGGVKRNPESSTEHIVVLHPSDEIRLIVNDIHEHLPPYVELSQQRMPRESIVDTLVSKIGFLPDPSEDAPRAFILQANFLRGGLMLTFHVHHCVLDGTSLGTLIDIVARLHAGLGLSPEDLEALSPIESRSSKFQGSPDPCTMITINNYPQHRLIPIDAPMPEFHPRPTSTCTGRIFHFTDAKLAELKASCKSPDTESWVSTNDALCALIWSAFTRANYPNPSASDLEKPIVLTTPINVRKRAAPPLSASYLGNAFIDVLTPLALGVLINSPLHVIASLLRKRVTAMDSTCIDNSLSLFRSPPEGMKLAPGYRDMLITSLTDLPAYSADFGPTLGKAEWVRFPYNPALYAINMLMPRRGDGIEVLGLLMTEQCERLLADQEFMKWVEHVTD